MERTEGLVDDLSTFVLSRPANKADLVLPRGGGGGGGFIVSERSLSAKDR